MTWRHSDKYVFFHLIGGECLPYDLIICKGFSLHTEDSLYVRAASIQMTPLVKQNAGPLLQDARNLLAGHFERCPYMRDAMKFLTGRISTFPWVL